MGDMADYFVELGVEQELNFFKDGGKVDSDRADDCDDEDIYVKTEKSCTKCGANNLHWQNTERGWRLFHQDGERHDCAGGISKSGGPKSTIGKITLGRRTIVKDMKISENGTFIYDWERVKFIKDNNIKDGQYVEVTTTEINNKITWIVKIKTKKSYVQEEIKFPPSFKPPLFLNDEPPF